MLSKAILPFPVLLEPHPLKSFLPFLIKVIGMKKYPVLSYIAAGWLFLAGLGCSTYTEIKRVEIEYRGENNPHIQVQTQNPQDAGKDYQLLEEHWLKKAEQTHEKWETAPKKDKDKIWKMYQRQQDTADAYGILAEKERELKGMFRNYPASPPKSLRDYRIESLTSPD